MVREEDLLGDFTRRESSPKLFFGCRGQVCGIIPVTNKFSSQYRDNIYQILHGHLICNGQVSISELEPVIDSKLYATIESFENAMNLMHELERKELIQYNDDGFQFIDNKIPEGIIFVWDYQRMVRTMV